MHKETDNGWSKNPFTRLFRLISMREGATKLAWQSLANQYFRRPEAGIATDKAVSQARYNLTRGVTQKDITANNFIEGLCVLGLKKQKIVIAVEMMDKNGEWTRESVEISAQHGGVVKDTSVDSYFFDAIKARQPKEDK